LRPPAIAALALDNMKPTGGPRGANLSADEYKQHS
jgi:hypothetical protein